MPSSLRSKVHAGSTKRSTVSVAAIGSSQSGNVVRAIPATQWPEYTGSDPGPVGRRDLLGDLDVAVGDFSTHVEPRQFKRHLAIGNRDVRMMINRLEVGNEAVDETQG